MIDLDSFVAEQINDLASEGEAIKPMTVEEADRFLAVLVDLLWPDIPTGCTVEDFTESWNRQANKMAAHN